MRNEEPGGGGPIIFGFLFCCAACLILGFALGYLAGTGKL